MAKLSIIVTIYNAETTLRRCLDSCLNQEGIELEIICVNDGSTDNTHDIIEEYVRRFSKQFKAVHSLINCGIGKARNIGLENSSGDYITFVDSDDYVEANCYTQLLTQAVDNKADIVVYDAYQVEENNRAYLAAIDFSNEGEITSKQYFLSKPYVWNKIVHKSLYMNNINFPEGIWYSEYACVPLLAINANKIIYVKKPYIIHDHANTIRRELKFRVKIMDIVKAITILNQNRDQSIFTEEVEFLAYQNILITTVEILNYYNQDQYLDETINYMKKYFPRWKSNPYVILEPKYKVSRADKFYQKKHKSIRFYDKLLHILNK